MTDKREEVRAALAPFLGGSARMDKATDAIMNLFTGAGVVSGLLPMEDAPKQTEGVLIFREDGAVASCWRGPGIAWRYSGSRWDCFVSDHDGNKAVGWLPLTVLTSRVTSALVPGVVSAAMVEAACEALQADVAKRHPEAEGGWPGRIPDKDLAIARNGMRLALTAALSPTVSEEEIRAEHLAEVTELRERLHAKHSGIRADVIEELKAAADGRSVVTPKRGNVTILGSGGGECEPLADWIARSLTNGGE